MHVISKKVNSIYHRKNKKVYEKWLTQTRVW